MIFPSSPPLNEMSYEVLFPSEQSYCVCGVSKNQRLRQAREVIANVGMDRRSKLTDAFLRLLVGVTSGSGNLNFNLNFNLNGSMN